MIDKKTHIYPGLQVKMVMQRCDAVHEDHDSWELEHGTIWSITNPPSRRVRKNGEGGVWVQGAERPLFVWFFEWIPFFPIEMIMIRTKKVKKP